MTTSIEAGTTAGVQLKGSEWAKLGLVTAIISIAAVLAVQAMATALWPEIKTFPPLDSYARSALFTLVPALGATVLLAWLVGRQGQATQRFVGISVIVLLISIIPDYILPVPNKTLLASTVAAFLHGVAAFVIVSVLLIGYHRLATAAASHSQIA
ncbi:MAG: hypothetical protein U0X20_11825 [Caldilineaceae bacterium]